MGKKISQLVSAEALTGNELVEISQEQSSVWVSARPTLATIAAYINSLVGGTTYSQQTIAAGASADINVGAQVTYGAVRVSYYAVKNGNHVTGDLFIVHDGTNVKVYDTRASIPSKPTISIKTGDLNAGQIRFRVTSESGGGNTTFVYAIINQIPLTA